MDYTFRKYLEALSLDAPVGDTPVGDTPADQNVPGELDQSANNPEAQAIFQQTMQTAEFLNSLLQRLHDAHLDLENKEHVERIQLEIQALLSNLQTIHV